MILECRITDWITFKKSVDSGGMRCWHGTARPLASPQHAFLRDGDHGITLTALPPGPGVAAKKDGEETPGSASLRVYFGAFAPGQTIQSDCFIDLLPICSAPLGSLIESGTLDLREFD